MAMQVTRTQIEVWLSTKIASLLMVEIEEIDVREPFQSFGLSSRQAVGISGDLEDWLGCELEATLLWDYPDIEALSQYLAIVCIEGRSKPDPYEVDAGREEANRGPVAIIGLGCRFPGANGSRELWDLLCAGVDAIGEVPVNRWSLAQFYDPDASKVGKMNTRWGGFLEDVDRFDAHFFGISPREAERMDPQQRLLLEVAWEALEDAGQRIEDLKGSATGVFIGIATNDYGRMQLNNVDDIDAYAGTGTAFSIAANRLSYFFDWYGPSMAIDTACSSSLVAVHMACQSIWSGDASMALAGGVNLLLSPAYSIHLTKAGAMAPDGRCKAFDRRADGYVRGEGVGVVVLKPLSQALKDRDPIHAVIRGSAINQDGRTNGLMAPNRLSQERMLREAYRRAGIAPQQVQYVEAHGTGTFLGDPIEVQALGNVLGPGRDNKQACIIGSVKTNIGHLEAAAGIAGLIKVCLMLHHRQIPPSLHFKEPNPHIPFEQLPLRVATQLEAWPEHAGPMSAGVSAFGFGGTNAHVVLSAAPANEDDSLDPIANEQAHILTLSARSMPALEALAQRYRDFLREQEPADWPAICATAGRRRSHHDWRLAIVARSSQEADEQLQAWLTVKTGARGRCSARADQRAEKIVFVFSGQGSQWLGMGYELWQREPVFRHALQECELALRPYLAWSLYDELFAASENSRMEDVDVLQVLIFAIAVGLARLWQEWGIEPAAVIGHSMGEVAAAYVAGSLSLQDACRIICTRSILQRQVQGEGAMLALDVGYEQAQQAIRGYERQLAIAAINGLMEVVVGGEKWALEQLRERLRRENTVCRYVRMNVAAHSPQMEPLSYELVERLDSIQAGVGVIPIYSTVTGSVETGEHFDVQYWGRNMREPVYFAQAMEMLIHDGYTTFLEVSPHPLLTHTIERALESQRVAGSALHSLRRERVERAEMLMTLATFYANGQHIAWDKVFHQAQRYISLPTYPWQHQRFWLQSLSSTTRAMTVANASSAQADMQTSSYLPALEKLREDKQDYVSEETEEVGMNRQAKPGKVLSSYGCEADQQRLEFLQTYLREQVAAILHLPVQQIETDKPLMAMGLDSMMALELKRKLESGLELPLHITLVWRYPTIEALSAYFLLELRGGLN